MIRQTTSRFAWQVTRRDGTFDPPVTFEVSAEDGEYLDAEWDDIQRMPPGEARSKRLRALVTMLDLFATFGGSFVNDEPMRLAA